jgi:hypothetical protein
VLAQRRPFLHELARALLLPIVSAAARRAVTIASSGRRQDASAPIA